MFLKASAMESTIISRNEAKVQGVSCKNASSADLLRGQYLFEILQTSLTVKKLKGNVAKTGCFAKRCYGERQFFFQNEGRI